MDFLDVSLMLFYGKWVRDFYGKCDMINIQTVVGIVRYFLM